MSSKTYLRIHTLCNIRQKLIESKNFATRHSLYGNPVAIVEPDTFCRYFTFLCKIVGYVFHELN